MCDLDTKARPGMEDFTKLHIYCIEEICHPVQQCDYIYVFNSNWETVEQFLVWDLLTIKDESVFL